MATHSDALSDLPSLSQPSALSPNPVILDGFLRKEELAQRLGVSARTIDRWHTLRCGPPRVSIGRTILYNLDSVRRWLQSRERDPSQRGRR